MEYSVVIPARYNSSRLPGKPLVDLCGIPMIIRTYQQCIKAVPNEKIYVATDDERISSICTHYHIQTVMTSSNCLTGTDRIAEVSNTIESDIYINVQGDEPLFNPDDLKTLIRSAKKYPTEVLNGYSAIEDEEHFYNRSIPKVVMKPDNRLLYMSRAPIPFSKSGKLGRAWRQVCAYAFPRNALRTFADNSKKTLLESIEDIEILRFIELGFSVRMIEMSNLSISVDTPEDITTVENYIQAHHLS